MFSSSGVLFGNYTSIVSNMIKASDIQQKFDAAAYEGGNKGIRLNLILPKSTNTPQFLKFSSEIIYRLYTASFIVNECISFFSVQECESQSKASVTIKPEGFQHNKYAYLVEPSKSKEFPKTNWKFDYS
jgi:hypothetical protein